VREEKHIGPVLNPSSNHDWKAVVRLQRKDLSPSQQTGMIVQESRVDETEAAPEAGYIISEVRWPE